MQHFAWAKAASVFVIAAIGLGGALWLLREPEEASGLSASSAALVAGRPSQRDGSPLQPAASSLPALAPGATPRASEGPHFDRARADALRERAALRRVAEQRVAEHARTVAGTSETNRAAHEAPPAMTAEEEQLRREYIRQAVREQYFPVARSCYQELLDRQPEAAGKVVMSFGIAGVGDAGVVDRVELGDDTTMDDPEFILCMRESMYSTVFEPPPHGATETTVVYPIELHP